MGKWLDLAAELEAATDGGDKKDDRDSSRPNAPNGPNVPQSIAPAAAAGLFRLQAMAAPKLRCPEFWPAVVADALSLARDGWAAEATSLGWTDLDLFGAMPDRDGDPAGDGLAVVLAGRKLLALCDDFATVEVTNGGRSYLYRHGSDAVVLLWELR